MGFNLKCQFGLVSIVAIGAVSLAGCGTKQEAAVEIPPVPAKVEKAATATKAAVGGAAAGSAAMLNVVKETKAAITAGDFGKAGAALEKFEGSWKLVKPGIQAKAPKAADAIEAGVGKLKGAIKAKDSMQAKAALTAIETSLAVAK
jgi:hypothetical protein